MPFSHRPTPSHNLRAQPKSQARTFFRRFRFQLIRARRAYRKVNNRLMLLSGWTWVAAGSLVGFEMLDILFGALILAPEFLPLVIIMLALIWVFREKLRELTQLTRDRIGARYKKYRGR